MKQYWFEYRDRDQWHRSPMAFWVHKPVDTKKFFDAKGFDPPLPSGKLFLVFFVEFDGFVFEFWSLDEMDVLIRTLSEKNLPDVRSEWQGRKAPGGPGKHWLNKLPGRELPWKYREKAVKYLRECRIVFAASARENSQ